MKFIGIFLLLYGGAILFYYTGQKNTRPGEEHGSASWGSVRELDKKYRDKDANQNVILTQHFQMSMNGKLHRRNLLQIVVGGSGSGKTRFLAKPNLMLANASFIVTDPKGEMLRAVGNLFLEEGYVLRVFDLIDPAKSDCYNPFCYIRKDADVFKLIDNFIKNTTPKGAKANDPFWEKSETALDAALMLYLLHEAPEEDQNMETILYMIENGGAKEEDDDYQSPLDRVGNDRKVFLVAQLLCAEQRRRAVVDHQMVPIVDHLADEVCNLVFEFDVRLAADGVGQVGFRTVAEDGAAVGFGGVALFFELVEVAADGFLRDLIVGSKLADQNALFGAEFLQNFVFAFNC